MGANTNSIETVSGRFISLLEPSTEDIFIEDIAWALCKMPRYAGHTLPLLPYSVAQHSVVVFRLVKRLANEDEIELRESFRNFTAQSENARLHPNAITNDALLEALFHDASEAYLMDIPTPLKHLPGMREAYGPIENTMMSAIRRRFELPEPSDFTLLLVKWADAYALTVEAYHLMKSRGRDWNKLLPVSLPALQNFEMPKPTGDVFDDFIEAFNYLQYQRTGVIKPTQRGGGYSISC
jgi:5'-deoxynucleotidase YfbR-like HD superfamily hydrolase